MELRKPKEYQTIRLFAVLGVLTLITVLLFKLVLLAPQKVELNRVPAQIQNSSNNELETIANPILKKQNGPQINGLNDKQ